MNGTQMAKLFHETYERLAPEFGYKTREASAVPWEDVPDNNKNLMVAVASEIVRKIKMEELGITEQDIAENQLQIERWLK